MNPVKVGLIGFGRMGGFYLDEMQKSGRWDVAYICDVCAESRDLARKLAPGAKVVDDEQVIFDDPEVQVVGLFALADSRKSQIERAFAAGKHVIAEKPISDSIENEWQAVELAENTPLFSTVNLYLRNSWYHNTIKDFIAQGEIGELAIIRVCHMTPGLAPGEGHEYEGPAFHDCGMHYVDIARWYAGSEFKTWNAQAVRMWNYKEPVEVAALQLLNVLFAVPQISVRLRDIPESHRRMLKFYLNFWREFRDVLLDGKLHARQPECNDTVVSAEKENRRVSVLYAAHSALHLAPQDGGTECIVNASGSVGFMLDLDREPVESSCFDAQGNVIRLDAIHAGLNRVSLPPAGMIRLSF